MKSFALHVADDWTGDGAGQPADYCSREGAMALKQKIEAYWRERGRDVMLSLHNVGFHPAIRAARYDVRSDMVNGFPRVSGLAPVRPASIPFDRDDLELDEDDLLLDP